MKPIIVSCKSVVGCKASKLSVKQSIRPSGAATVNDPQLRQLIDLAGDANSDVSELARADLFREFGLRSQDIARGRKP